MVKLASSWASISWFPVYQQEPWLYDVHCTWIVSLTLQLGRLIKTRGKAKTDDPDIYARIYNAWDSSFQRNHLCRSSLVRWRPGAAKSQIPLFSNSSISISAELYHHQLIEPCSYCRRQIKFELLKSLRHVEQILSMVDWVLFLNFSCRSGILRHHCMHCLCASPGISWGWSIKGR